jgi:hypothetical protein
VFNSRLSRCRQARLLRGQAQATDSVMTEWLQLASAFDAVYLMDLRTGQLQRLDEHEDK